MSPQELHAYDLHLKGEYLFARRNPSDLQKAVELLQQATSTNPNDARAYAALANSYALLAGYSAAPPTEFVAKARAAALHAIQLDDRLPDAHSALALIVQNYDWDWHTADEQFRRAIELNPNNATAHHWYAEHLMWRGDFQQALQESEKARQLDPLSLIITADNGALLYYSRQYDLAIRQLRGVLDLNPSFPRGGMIIFPYVAKAMFPQALAVIAQQWRQRSDNPWGWASLAYIHGRAGHRAEARHALEKLEQLGRRQQLDPAVFVWAYLGMGDKPEVLSWLQKAYAQHSNMMTTLKVEPAFDPLRSDRRFQDLVTRVGLAQ